MSEIVQILIAKYPTPIAAEDALKKLKTARENQGAQVDDAAVVSRTGDGKLHIHETADVTGGRGAAVGGILGAVLGILAGPPGMVAGAALGAAVGGAAASVLDTGIPHQQLEAIGATLPPDGAALVVLTEAGYVPFIESVIGGDNIEVITESMDAEAAQKMGRDHDIALKAIRMGDAVADGGAVSPSKPE